MKNYKRNILSLLVFIFVIQTLVSEHINNNKQFDYLLNELEQNPMPTCPDHDEDESPCFMELDEPEYEEKPHKHKKRKRIKDEMA